MSAGHHDRRPPRGRVVLAIGALAVAGFLVTACSLDWVVVPKEAGPDDDGGAESKASLDDAAKLAS